MQKPLINNRRLNEKWSAQTNELMIKKLQGVKPQINSRCPESFFFFKTQFKKPNLNTNKLAKIEIAKNNENLLRKLLDVNIERNSKSNMQRQPVFTFKKNFLTGNKKYDIIKIAQENQSMLKRLNERSSFYDVNKWEKDYQMNQYYKRNHCMFPSIDFKKSHSGIFNSTVKSSPGQNCTGLTVEKKKYNNSCSNFSQIDHFQEEPNEKSNYIQINEDSQDKDDPKVLFKTQVYLDTLGSCSVEFAVQTQNFTIKIESLYEKERIYGIIFDSRKSVENIQRYYKKYEEMIKELEYDEKNDVVKFNNLIKKELICRCVKLPPKNAEKGEKSEGIEVKEKKEDKQMTADVMEGDKKDVDLNVPQVKTEEDIKAGSQEVKMNEPEANQQQGEVVVEYSDKLEQDNKNSPSQPIEEETPNENIELNKEKEEKEGSLKELNAIIKEENNSNEGANQIAVDERNEEKEEENAIEENIDG